MQTAIISHLQEILSGSNYAQVVIRELPRIGDPRRRRLIDARNKYELIFIKLIKDLGIRSEIKCDQLRFLIMGLLIGRLSGSIQMVNHQKKLPKFS